MFSFFKLNTIPLCIYPAFCQCILSMDTWVASAFWLLGITLLWIWVYKYLFQSLLSILLSVYTEMGLLDQMICLFLIFFRNHQTCFPRRRYPLAFPPTSAQGFQLLHILANACYFPFYFLSFSFFFKIAILMGVRWYLLGALICISLMIKDTAHLFKWPYICFFLYFKIWRENWKSRV